MLTKILFTALVIVIVYAVFRTRTRTPPPAKAPHSDASIVAPRTIAYVFIGVFAVTSIGLALHQWRQAHETVTIRVVNTRTGDAVTYKANKGKVHGRVFETLDGRRVTVADVERVEVLEEE